MPPFQPFNHRQQPLLFTYNGPRVENEAAVGRESYCIFSYQRAERNLNLRGLLPPCALEKCGGAEVTGVHLLQRSGVKNIEFILGRELAAHNQRLQKLEKRLKILYRREMSRHPSGIIDDKAFLVNMLETCIAE